MDKLKYWVKNVI